MSWRLAFSPSLIRSLCPVCLKSSDADRLPVKSQVFPVFGHCNSWSMYLPPLAITFGHGIVRVYSEGLLIISHVTSSSGDVQSFFHTTRTFKSGKVGTPNTPAEGNRHDSQ